MRNGNPYEHFWSGWPGAFCQKCGCEDAMEIAIGNSDYDPYSDTWISETTRLEYARSKSLQPCPISDQEYVEYMKTKGIDLSRILQ